MNIKRPRVGFEPSTSAILKPYNFCIRSSNKTSFGASKISCQSLTRINEISLSLSLFIFSTATVISMPIHNICKQRWF